MTSTIATSQLTLILENLCDFNANPNHQIANLLADAIEEGIDCMTPMIAASILEVIECAPDFATPIINCINNCGYLND